jgi:hypothetical protein
LNWQQSDNSDKVLYMKKILGIIVFSFLWCNTLLAESAYDFLKTDLEYSSKNNVQTIYAHNSHSSKSIIVSKMEVMMRPCGDIDWTNPDRVYGIDKKVSPMSDRTIKVNARYTVSSENVCIRIWAKFANSGGTSSTNDKKKLKKKVSTKYKKSPSTSNNFMSSFVLSWVFAGILWGIIIFYFKVLGSIGKITKKIDKKIPGTHEMAFYIGGAVTWYLAWALLFGFEAALLVNFVFIYLAVWGSATVFILNKISESINSKSGMYFVLFLGACSLGLAVEMIGPFIKFLKAL